MLRLRAPRVHLLVTVSLALTVPLGSASQALAARGAAPPRGDLVAAVSGPEPMVTVGTMTFHSSGYTIRDLRPDQMYWYRTEPIGLTDTEPHDATGVRMAVVGGKLVDHPVAQAQYTMRLMSSWMLTHDPAYLDRAVLNAQRLLDRAVVSRGATYFPYPFDFVRGGPTDVMTAPWYSAMAQGQAITAFYLIYQATKDAKWAAAMEGSYRTFLNARTSDGSPWTVFVDADAYLWFDLYPKDPPDVVLNGDIFATLGVIDYWRLTKDPQALALASGAITGILHHLPDFRNPSWVSYYCLTHHDITIPYHLFVLQLLLQVQKETGSAVFAAWSDLLRTDYPIPDQAGTARFPAGWTTGYRFDFAGNIVGSKAYWLSRASSAPVSQRARVHGRVGSWLYVTAGVWAGYYVRESSGLFIQGSVMRVAYDPGRTVVFQPGIWTGYRFDSTGHAIASVASWFGRASQATGIASAVINGATYLQISNGIYAGYWVARSAGVDFAVHF